MHHIDDNVLRKNLMEAYLNLDCYPEVPMAPATLKDRGFRLAILSNGTRAMLEAAVKNSGISELIEKTLSEC
jgi:2-haloacid dehalogenase